MMKSGENISSRIIQDTLSMSNCKLATRTNHRSAPRILRESSRFKFRAAVGSFPLY
jgi:hypothetical protein